MILTTTESIPHKEYEILGLVEGNTIQSVHLGKDLLSGLKTLVGGELTSYNEMMTLNTSLMNLVKEGKLTEAEACAVSEDENELVKMLKGAFTGTKNYYE